MYSKVSRWINKVDEWSGIMLILAASIATIWLSFEEKLKWYIHPRYELFSLALATTGVLLALAALITLPKHNHKTSHKRYRPYGTMVIIISSVVMLLVIQPAALTSLTVSQRVMNSGVNATSDARESAILKERGSYTNFTIKDWSLLLSQSSDPKQYQNKPAKVSGFITASKDENVFFVSRFVVTCCALDARPIGVPVYSPGWRKTFAPDQWVETSGVFIANPNTNTTERTVLSPDYVRPIDKEKNQYVY
jgi:TIGR03943 family protein